MRTLPQRHAELVRELSDLITHSVTEPGATVSLTVVKDSPGSVTPATSPIVRTVERATQRAAQGFNGGDEGRVLRLAAAMEGVTLGPGDLRVAHTPNEHVSIVSVLRAADLYATLFAGSVAIGDA
jgi:acetylornithine deacetylase/succinyl-diaminopimelate desuccinylase-like protein